MVGYLSISQIMEAFGLQAKSFEVVQVAFLILAVSVVLSSIFLVRDIKLY